MRLRSLAAALLLLATITVHGQRTAVTSAGLEVPNVFTNTDSFNFGVKLGPVTFSQLSAITNSTTIIYVSDAVFGSNPCAGGGSGALAVLISGQWNCAGGAGGVSLLVDSTPSTSQTRLNLISGTNVTLVNTLNGDVVINASGGGGGGSPGGSDTQIQVNTLSSFGGAFNSTFNSTTGQTNTANFSKIRYVTSFWNWSQSPAADLSSPGAGKTITLTCGDGGTGHSNPCIGIDTSANSAKPFSVYVSTVGTPEAALVTGGTCSLFATANCTIIITTANAHTAGYSVGSAYAGIQEAMNDAGSPDAKIVLQPVGANTNAYQIYAPIFFQNQRSVLEGDGTLLKCNTRSACLILGDLVSVNDFLNEKVHGLRIASGTNIAGVAVSNTSRTGCPGAGTCQINITTGAPHPFVVGDYVDIQMTNDTTYWGIWKITSSADNTHFVALYASQVNGPAPGTNVGSAASIGQVALANSAIWDNAGISVLSEIQFESGSTAPVGKFHNGIVNFNDQAEVIDKPSLNSGSAFRCDSTYCANGIYGPGPFFPNAGIIYVRGGILSGCNLNLITNYDGNTLSVSDIVLQAFNQWAINNSALRGGFGTGTYSNIYNEVGACTNPDYNSATQASQQAEAGIIGGGSVRGGEFPIGNMPSFFCSGAAGANPLYYWVVVHDSVLGTSAPLQAGLTAASCSGNVTVQWPRVDGTNTVTYDILRYGSSAGIVIAPFIGGCAGGSALACGSVATAQAQCSVKVCSFTDNATASTTNYTVTFPNFYPELYFWPGGAILGTTADTQSVSSVLKLYMDSTASVTPGSPLVTESSWQVPTFFAQECTQQVPGVWVSCLAMNSAGNNGFGSTFLQGGIYNGGTTAGLKGRIGFNWSLVVNGEWITLVDACPSCTVASGKTRPLANSADTWIGSDNTAAVQPSSTAMAFGAPVSISSYINKLGDGLQWLERLTATNKTFVVPVTMASRLSVLGGCFVGCGPLQPSGTQVSDFGTGSNFTAITGTFTYGSSQASFATAGPNGFALTSYTASTFNAAHFSQVKAISFTGGSIAGPCTDMSNVAGTRTAYCIEAAPGSATLIKITAGGSASVLVGSLPAVAIGDLLTLQSTPNASATATTLTYLQNGAIICAAPPCTLTTIDSSSPFVSGFPGIFAENVGATLGTFQAGDLSYSTADPITVQNITITGTCTGCGSGSVTNSGALTNTAFVTGVGAAVVKTPSATATLDVSGNAIFPGSITSTLVNGGVSGAEGTGANAGAAGAGVCVAWNDSTDHRPKYNCNNAGNVDYASTLPSGTVTTAGTVVNAGTSQAQTNITLTGALTTDNVVANIGATLPATWQTGIVLWAHVTAANTVTVYLTNPTAGNITPVATLVTVRILR